MTIVASALNVQITKALCAETSHHQTSSWLERLRQTLHKNDWSLPSTEGTLLETGHCNTTWGSAEGEKLPTPPKRGDTLQKSRSILSYSGEAPKTVFVKVYKNCISRPKISHTLCGFYSLS